MPIITAMNQYRGLNAHFQSWMQSLSPKLAPLVGDDWVSFHTNHLVHIGDALNDQLPQGYFARPEKSLQVSIEEPETETKLTRTPRPDVSVWQRSPQPKSPSGIIEAVAPTIVISRLEEAYPEMPEKPPTALVIYGDQQPITRIELLSPANKQRGSYFHAYTANRELAIANGQALIELDYLHQTQPVLLKMPFYPDEADSYPYNIIISNPRQSFEVGQVLIYGFNVDQPIPVVGVPLLEELVMPFDFGAVYHETYRRGRWGHNLDYETLPVQFERYSPTDQERIKQRMAIVQAAHQKGLDLEKEFLDESVLETQA